MLRDLDYVIDKLDWMEAEAIWPNGLRYLWTDAFGVVLYLSLYRALDESAWLARAAALVEEVERVLGRPRGLRIGEAPDRDGQYFHYLAMWLFALARLGEIEPAFRARAVALVREIHRAFVLPGRGVVWKMREDLSAPYPGYGLGALDAFHGYVVYRLLDEEALAPEIAEFRALVEDSQETLHIEQDLALGVMLWLAHFFPEEPWAHTQRRRCLETLERMWVEPPGCFVRSPAQRDLSFAFTNYGVSLGLQATGVWPERVARLNRHFEHWRAGNEYDREAITWVMACSSHLPGLLLTERRREVEETMA